MDRVVYTGDKTVITSVGGGEGRDTRQTFLVIQYGIPYVTDDLNEGIIGPSYQTHWSDCDCKTLDQSEGPASQ